jgi:hypothetical protein
MISNIPKLLTFYFLFLLCLQQQAQEIWREEFPTPERGIWGDVDGETIHSDFSGVTTWTLEYNNLSLSSPDDYAKTVSTSGGRFECRDIDGEVTWRSEKINISGYQEVRVQFKAVETGSGTNEQNKYIKAFFILDEQGEIPFGINAENTGNWGSSVVEQSGIVGESLQLVVYMNNHYSSDKIYLEDMLVTGKEDIVPVFPGELVINEILFDPFPEGNDYVEIYNNSEKELPVHQLYLASRDKNLELTQIYPLSNTKHLLPPGNYLALTRDTNGVFPWFTIRCPECFLQTEKFPSFNNDDDYVVLLDAELGVIDELYYTDEMHSELLFDTEGISLERISFSKQTNMAENWHSASTDSGYGTPGYQNSQYENENLISPQITFSPESFSPNNDGYNDEYKIHYQLDKPGYYANVRVFDSAGRFVLQLTKNSLLASSGEITWNGEDETGQRQSMGVYVVVVEMFDLNGNVKRYKDGVVLTDVLD